MTAVPKLHVLVVDDDEALRASLIQSLTGHGHEAEGVADGAEALARLRRLPVPGLVLLDMVLPYVNGRELLAEMRRTPRLKRIPVIAISADGTHLAHAEGADALLPKPFTLRSLLDLLDRLGPRAGR